MTGKQKFNTDGYQLTGKQTEGSHCAVNSQGFQICVLMQETCKPSLSWWQCSCVFLTTDVLSISFPEKISPVSRSVSELASWDVSGCLQIPSLLTGGLSHYNAVCMMNHISSWPIYHIQCHLINPFLIGPVPSRVEKLHIFHVAYLGKKLHPSIRIECSTCPHTQGMTLTPILCQYNRKWSQRASQWTPSRAKDFHISDAKTHFNEHVRRKKTWCPNILIEQIGLIQKV